MNSSPQRRAYSDFYCYLSVSHARFSFPILDSDTCSLLFHAHKSFELQKNCASQRICVLPKQHRSHDEFLKLRGFQPKCDVIDNLGNGKVSSGRERLLNFALTITFMWLAYFEQVT